jgi:hypothetical protein
VGASSALEHGPQSQTWSARPTVERVVGSKHRVPLTRTDSAFLLANLGAFASHEALGAGRRATHGSIHVAKQGACNLALPSSVFLALPTITVTVAAIRRYCWPPQANEDGRSRPNGPDREQQRSKLPLGRPQEPRAPKASNGY